MAGLIGHLPLDPLPLARVVRGTRPLIPNPQIAPGRDLADSADDGEEVQPRGVPEQAWRLEHR